MNVLYVYVYIQVNFQTTAARIWNRIYMLHYKHNRKVIEMYNGRVENKHLRND